MLLLPILLGGRPESRAWPRYRRKVSSHSVQDSRPAGSHSPLFRKDVMKYNYSWYNWLHCSRLPQHPARPWRRARATRPRWPDRWSSSPRPSSRLSRVNAPAGSAGSCAAARAARQIAPGWQRAGREGRAVQSLTQSSPASCTAPALSGPTLRLTRPALRPALRPAIVINMLL